MLPSNVQLAVPRGRLVKLEHRCSRLPRFSPFTPDAEPVAPCASPSYTPLKPFTVMLASAWLKVIIAEPLADLTLGLRTQAQCAVPPGTPVKLAPRCSRLPRISPFTPHADTVAPC